MRKIRVLIVDDHTIVRDGICALLSLIGDIEVVGDAADGREALEKVRQLVPDVVLMDISMPLMDGREATRRICKDFPETRVLVLTQYDDREHIFPLIQAGARGFISKFAASSELASGIRAVYRGDSFMSPSVARVFIENYQRVASGSQADPYEGLTEREREVLRLVAEGYTTREIADLLVVSPKTVEGHKSSLMSKLGLRNRVELVRYAIRKGIITP